MGNVGATQTLDGHQSAVHREDQMDSSSQRERFCCGKCDSVMTEKVSGPATVEQVMDNVFAPLLPVIYAAPCTWIPLQAVPVTKGKNGTKYGEGATFEIPIDTNQCGMEGVLPQTWEVKLVDKEQGRVVIEHRIPKIVGCLNAQTATTNRTTFQVTKRGGESELVTTIESFVTSHPLCGLPLLLCVPPICPMVLVNVLLFLPCALCSEMFNSGRSTVFHQLQMLRMVETQMVSGPAPEQMSNLPPGYETPAGYTAAPSAPDGNAGPGKLELDGFVFCRKCGAKGVVGEFCAKDGNKFSH